MSLTFNGFHTLELHQLRKYIVHKSCLIEQSETNRRLRSHQNLVKLLHYPLLGQNLHPATVTGDRLQRLRNNGKRLRRSSQLGRETYCANHAQRIIAVGRVRIQRSADNARCQVSDATERIDKSAEILLLQAESHGIYREVATQLIILQRAVLHYRVARVARIRLLASPNELNLDAAIAQHGCAVSLEHGYIAVHTLSHSLGKRNAAALHHYVYILAWTSQKTVTHITPDHESAHALLGCDFRNDRKYLMIQKTLCNSC